ncbi:MAG TPA: hypothetical protein VJM74_06680 [Nitrososphaeraceae archaeon]|nr:hypothetical protein [Nitrososphaeraceae archaeon]
MDSTIMYVVSLIVRENIVRPCQRILLALTDRINNDVGKNNY